MNVLCIQPDIVWEDRPANHARVASLIEAASPAPGTLIVLPEMFASGFSLDLTKTLEGDEPFLSSLATRYRSCVIGGIVTQGSPGRGLNQAVAFSPDGTELARYSKIHPFSLGGECDVHDAGSTAVTFPWGGFTVAPLVCYDLRFPETFREAARKGSNLFVVIALWPAKRQYHWLTLLQARAIENQAYVIGVNRTGNDPRHTYAGRSVVVDPYGFVISDAGEKECALASIVRCDAADEWRREFPALRDAGW